MSDWLDSNCPVGATLKVLSGKWKILILFRLAEGTKRFNALRKEIPQVTQRMLTNQLRELENDKIITRTVYAQVPPKVEYALSPIGETLKPVLNHLKEWGMCYIDKRQQQDRKTVS